MRLDETSFLETCGETWNTALGLRLGPLAPNETRAEEPTLTSSIPINGSWFGALQLRCPESVARHAAIVLLAADDDEQLTHQDLQAALNELARRVVQSMNGLLPPSSKPLEPCSADDPGLGQTLVGMLPTSELRLSCEGRPIDVRLLQAGDD